MSTCKNGHDLDGPNPFYVRKNGSRRCRQCKRASEKRHNQRNPGRQARYKKRLRAYYAAYMHTVRGSESHVREAWTPEEVETLLRLWSAGATAPDISAQIGRTPSTIYLRLRILRLSGVPVPTRSVLAKTYPVAMPEPEPIYHEPVSVAPLAPRGFAVYASGIVDTWSDNAPIGAGR